MGRRSINTTKSGKFMNPTDQARKEARKKELKKNRRQRQMVRAAVLKGKDPNQLIVEMEKIDQMEYDVNNPPSLNEKVLKDKRKKLRETFQRILKLYEKEDREQWIELKKLEQEYEKKRNQMIQYFESVKHAEQVKLEEIPLPNMPGEAPSNSASQIPLPDEIPLPMGPGSLQPQSILKKSSDQKSSFKHGKHPPGVPPGPPPALSDDEEPIETELVKETETSSSRSKRIRFQDEEEKEETLENTDENAPTRLQAKMLAMAGQDINEFLQEMEAVHQQKTEESEDMPEESRKPDSDMPSSASSRPSAPLPPGPPPGAPPSHIVYNRPPPPQSNIRPLGMPPGPPPRLLPPGPPPGMPPRMGGPIRLPPGPPPGLPPRMMRPGNMPMQVVQPPPSASQTSLVNPNVLSAPPSLISRSMNKHGMAASGKTAPDDKKSSGATIEAKPQLRNLSADVTKFMPTSLRVKREDKVIKKREPIPVVPLGLRADDMTPFVSQPRRPSSAMKGPTRDDAYDQFMKEMEDFL